LAEGGIAEKTEKHRYAEPHHNRVHHEQFPFAKLRNLAFTAYKFEGLYRGATI
jgi:hypothetical protein